MKVLSWNYRGLGTANKQESVRRLVNYRPMILLLQETKLENEDVQSILNNLWHKGNQISINARGASGGICTQWNPAELSLLDAAARRHWLYTIFHDRYAGIRRKRSKLGRATSLSIWTGYLFKLPLSLVFLSSDQKLSQQLCPIISLSFFILSKQRI